MVGIITVGIYIIHITLIGFKIIIEPTDIIRTIKDPEKPATLEDLNVVYENGVVVSIQNNDFINWLTNTIIYSFIKVTL